MRHRIFRLDLGRGIVRMHRRLKRRRRSKDDRHDLAFHVYPFVVVVALFRRGHSSSHVHHWSFHRCIFPARISSCDGILAKNQRLFFPSSHQRHSSLRFVCASRSQRHTLEISPVVSRSFQSHPLEFRGHVFCGDVVPAVSGSPPFEQIVGEKSHVGTNGLRTDRLHCGVGSVALRARDACTEQQRKGTCRREDRFNESFHL